MDVNARALASLALLTSLGACGGGSSDVSLEGIWKGSYTPDSPFTPEPFHAIVQDAGPGFFYDDQGFVFVIPSIVGGNFDFTASLYPPYGFIFTSGSVSLPSTVKGDASNGQISGKLLVNGAFADFDLKPSTPYSGAPGIVAGVWSGNYIGGAAPSNVAWHMSSTGGISGSDSYGCTVTGSIKATSPGENLFSVSVKSAGASQICAGAMTGLAYESTRDELDLFGHATGTYYYVAARSPHGAFVAEFKVQ